MDTRTPCSPPERAPLYAKARVIIDEGLDSCAHARADLSVAHTATVTSVKQFQEMMVQAHTEEVMSEQISWKCPRCGVLLGYHDTQAKQAVSPDGVAEYRRGRYRCGQCGEEYVPADELNDLERTSFTLDAREAMVTKASGETYRDVVDDVGPSLVVSRQTVARTVTEVAGWCEAEQEQALAGAFGDLEKPGPLPSGEGNVLASSWEEKELPADAAICLSADGGKVRTCEKKADGSLEWREARVATVGVTSGGKQIPRKKAGGKLYLGRVMTAMQTIALLAAAYLGLPAELRALPVFFIADGGPWWEWVSAYLPRAVQILDIFHAGEKCVAAAKLCFAEDAEEVRRWDKHIREWLMEKGGVEKVTDALSQACPDASIKPAVHHEVQLCIAYLQEHRHRMRYSEFAAMGWSIGSGVVESAVDQVMAERLRLSGMKWRIDHADDMMCVRSAVLSGEMPAVIQRRKDACRERTARYLEPLQQAA